MADATMVQQAYTTILKHVIKTGRAPHYTEVAATLGLTPDEGRELQKEAAEAGVGCWLIEDTDYIESWAPFSNVPNQYQLTVEGDQKWHGT
jgi:hypothetical protein